MNTEVFFLMLVWKAKEETGGAAVLDQMFRACCFPSSVPGTPGRQLMAVSNSSS